MSSLVPSFGKSSQSSDLQFILQDLLDGMGDYLSKEPGSLNWIECYVNARALAQDLQFIRLMANQLSPASSSVLLPQWQTIYNAPGTSPDQVLNFIEFKQALFNTPPTLSALYQFFQEFLGPIFIDLEWRPELQQFATTDPTTQIEKDGYSYASPLSTVMVYLWQPRDNQDHWLMPTPAFNSIVESYHALIESWNPAYISFQTMNLTNRGNQDGYAGGYNGTSNYNNYLDNVNTILATAGSNSILGRGTRFTDDFSPAIVEGFYPPIQIVDDAGALQTYYVNSVSDNLHMTVTTPIINNITNRTYRTIGWVLDQVDMLDNMLAGV